MVDYIDGFSYVEPSLHPWDEAYLIMVDDFSDVSLDSICQYFIEKFCINVHEAQKRGGRVKQKHSGECCVITEAESKSLTTASSVQDYQQT
ncbi:hypothetical protein H671_5g14620 [Cricetulus griseus]|nr:hypothetical protein H671_5g14620 [Cricetulus griseus]